jgi:hypothetical protein
MVYTNVITMKVPITAYIMFIVFSFVVCPSDCGVTVDQKYGWYDIQNKSSIEILQKYDSVNKTKVLFPLVVQQATQYLNNDLYDQ